MDQKPGKWHRVTSKKPISLEDALSPYLSANTVEPLPDIDWFLVDPEMTQSFILEVTIPPEPEVMLYLGTDGNNPAMKFSIGKESVFEIGHDGSTWTRWERDRWWKRRTKAQKAANEFVRCIKTALSL